MEVISQTQLYDYDEILQQINKEYEKCEHLKCSIVKEDNRIITKKLSENDGKFKISHVTIKIFNNINEIFTLYEQEIEHLNLEEFTNLENVKFGLIEIFITNSLFEKLSSNEWKINIKVSYPKVNYCKITKLSHKTPMLEIIPFQNDVWEFAVEIGLFGTSDFGTISLYKTDIDISYYFQSNKHKESMNHNQNYLKISQLYSNDNQLEFSENLPQNQCQFYCNFKSKSDLIACIIKNSYHRLDLEIFSKFTRNSQNDILEIQFYIDDNKVLLSYNCLSQIMKIRCNLKFLSKLKQYFIQSSEFNYERIRPKIQAVLLKKDELVTANMEQLLQLYQEIRNLWL